jgi:hypothetical protein
MVIGVDFDGTIVEHRYPVIGRPVPGALRWMKQFVKDGAQIVLWTMRSDSPQSGPTLTEAVEYLRANGIELFGVNTNPTQCDWTSSPKAYCQVYIDDAAFGCPLKESPRVGGRPYVDWNVVGPAVMEMLKVGRD